jgi:hypothetical protein
MPKKAAVDHVLTPPVENAALKWKKLTEPQQDRILAMALHPSAAVQSMLKPAEGMEPVAEKVFDLLEGSPAIAKALKLDVPELRARSAEHKDLVQFEGTTYKLYRRAATNRMAADSEIYSAMLKVNRFVQNCGDAEVADDFSELTKWIAGNHRHADAQAAEETPSDKKDEKPAAKGESPTSV